MTLDSSAIFMARTWNSRLITYYIFYFEILISLGFSCHTHFRFTNQKYFLCWDSCLAPLLHTLHPFIFTYMHSLILNTLLSFYTNFSYLVHVLVLDRGVACAQGNEDQFSKHVATIVNFYRSIFFRLNSLKTRSKCQLSC